MGLLFRTILSKRLFNWQPNENINVTHKLFHIKLHLLQVRPINIKLQKPRRSLSLRNNENILLLFYSYKNDIFYNDSLNIINSKFISAIPNTTN